MPQSKTTTADAAEALGRAQGHLSTEDYTGAVSALSAALAPLGDLSALAAAAVEKAEAMVTPLVAALEDETKENPSAKDFMPAYEILKMALRLDPENAEAAEGMSDMAHLVEGGDESSSEEEGAPRKRKADDAGVESSKEVRRRKEVEPNHSLPLDVVIVGAGASGVGVALMLTAVFGLDADRVQIVERGDGVGETFKRWPKEMRFISPSFNNQGWTKSFDLNSVAHGTSPAFTLHAEHPTGEQYAKYLAALAEENKLNVRGKTEVTSVTPFPDGKGFEVGVAAVGKGKKKGAQKQKPLRCRYVVWAAGEFQYPKTTGLFPGAEHCKHNSTVRSWAELPGNDFVVVGGYESGMDAASNLSLNNKRCTVLSSTAHWRVTDSDPSIELAPFTADRVRVATASKTPPRLLAPFRVSNVAPAKGGGFVVRATRGEDVSYDVNKNRTPLHDLGTADTAEDKVLEIKTPHPPLLCTGFEGSHASDVVKHLFTWGGEEEEGASAKDGEGAGGCLDGAPLLTVTDESRKTPGLFLAGPAVRHEDLVFCFVYKFRQRFGIIADAIVQGLGYDSTEGVQTARDQNMYLDEFSCCEAACGETC